jgi:hypothetical protein
MATGDDKRRAESGDATYPTIGHEALDPGADVIEYGVRIGRAPEGLAVGDYVHTHNIKSARW